MTSLLLIVAASLFGGLASLALAGWLAFRLPSRAMGRMIAFAAGTMLAAALLDILPEAFQLAPSGAQPLCATLLIALIAFFLLERMALWRHAHAEPHHHHAEGGTHALGQGAVWAVLVGDGVHNFVDGVLLAAAFLADPWLGLTTTLAVMAHEVPQELGDFVLLLEAGWSRRNAMLANGASGLTSVLGGIVGWCALESARGALPYVLAIAAASFIYIAVADLMPLLHARRRVDGFIAQSALLAAGLAIIPLVGHWLH